MSTKLGKIKGARKNVRVGVSLTPMTAMGGDQPRLLALGRWDEALGAIDTQTELYRIDEMQGPCDGCGEWLTRESKVAVELRSRTGSKLDMREHRGRRAYRLWSSVEKQVKPGVVERERRHTFWCHECAVKLAMAIMQSEVEG